MHYSPCGATTSGGRKSDTISQKHINNWTFSLSKIVTTKITNYRMLSKYDSMLPTGRLIITIQTMYTCGARTRTFVRSLSSLSSYTRSLTDKSDQLATDPERCLFDQLCTTQKKKCQFQLEECSLTWYNCICIFFIIRKHAYSSIVWNTYITKSS